MKKLLTALALLGAILGTTACQGSSSSTSSSTSSSAARGCLMEVQEGAYGQYWVAWRDLRPGHTCDGDAAAYRKAVGMGDIVTTGSIPQNAQLICSPSQSVNVYANPDDFTAWGQEALCH